MSNYYPQSERRVATMTVAQLIERLAALNPDLPVIFQSPKYGAFGSNATYSIDAVTETEMPRREDRWPGGSYIDEETGEEVKYEETTNVFYHWHGVVIA